MGALARFKKNLNFSLLQRRPFPELDSGRVIEATRSLLPTPLPGDDFFQIVGETLRLGRRILFRLYLR